MPSSHERPLRVLVLTGQGLVAETVKLILDHGIYVTRDTRDPGEAVRIFEDWNPHLAILDMDREGEHVVLHIGRSSNRKPIRTPILALTRRGDLKTKLMAFALGVDDIISIPVSPEELLARVIVLTRRSLGADIPVTPVLRIGALQIDIMNRQVRIGTSDIHLSGIEQSLLYLLAANAGQVISRDDLSNALWGVDDVVGRERIDQHVRHLRATLQDDWPRPRFIATVPGGYSFVTDFLGADGTTAGVY